MVNAVLALIVWPFLGKTNLDDGILSTARIRPIGTPLQDPVLICCPFVSGTFCVRQKLMKLLRDVREGTWPGSGVDCPSLAKPAIITLGSSSSDSWGSDDPALPVFVAAAAFEVAVLVLALAAVLEAVDRMIEVENLEAVFDRTDVVLWEEAVAVVALAEAVTPRTEVSAVLSDVTVTLVAVAAPRSEVRVVVTAVDVLVRVFPLGRVEEVDSTVDSVDASEVVPRVLVVNRTRVDVVAADERTDELFASLMPNLLVVALACDAERVTVRVTGSVGHGVDEDEDNAATVLVLVFVLVFLPVLMSFAVAAEVATDVVVVAEVEVLVAAAVLVLVSVISIVEVLVRVCVAIPVLVTVLVTIAVCVRVAAPWTSTVIVGNEVTMTVVVCLTTTVVIGLTVAIVVTTAEGFSTVVAGASIAADTLCEDCPPRLPLWPFDPEPDPADESEVCAGLDPPTVTVM